ncbi:hypothetical protein [Paucilactobacillus sp. N302-9]
MNENCVYCHEPYKPIIKANGYDSMDVTITSNGWLEENGSNGYGGSTTINYCPMCGRKL